MQENRGMRHPSKSHTLIAPSIEEIQEWLVHGATPRIGRKVKFRGRKLYPGPLLNAIVLHFLSLPHGRQIEIAEEYLRRYEALLDLDEPAREPGQAASSSRENPGREARGKPGENPGEVRGPDITMDLGPRPAHEDHTPTTKVHAAPKRTRAK